ncbi:MAG: hypothetical protein BWY68_00964 [bacterium ADurb.Bin400]|nr:MAG: hypothetical protein BWY68_00964 [bacterium ADurb.Bin400]
MTQHLNHLFVVVQYIPNAFDLVSNIVKIYIKVHADMFSLGCLQILHYVTLRINNPTEIDNISLYKRDFLKSAS